MHDGVLSTILPQTKVPLMFSWQFQQIGVFETNSEYSDFKKKSYNNGPFKIKSIVFNEPCQSCSLPASSNSIYIFPVTVKFWPHGPHFNCSGFVGSFCCFGAGRTQHSSNAFPGHHIRIRIGPLTVCFVCVLALSTICSICSYWHLLAWY